MSNTNLLTPIFDGAIHWPSFFNGRLLSGEVLSDEQCANREARLRIGRSVGEGIAYGLEVEKIAGGDTRTTPVVTVKAGLAVNRRGKTVMLASDVDVSLVRSSNGSTVASAGFDDCQPPQGGTYRAGNGVYVLTILPAKGTEGRAPVSGLGNVGAVCNTRYKVEGVQFNLVQLPMTQAELGDEGHLRNIVAYKCFGVAEMQSFLANPFGPAVDRYGLLDELRPDQLTDCEVPLAVLHWTTTDGINFIDMWSVRRRIAKPVAEGNWSPLVADRRLAEAEAMFLQFQEQIEDVRREPITPLNQQKALERFQYLPPSGFLPVNGGGFDWKKFLGPQAPDNEIPLSLSLARAVLMHSFDEDPVEVAQPNTPKESVVRMHVYRPSGSSGLVLFARSSLAEVAAEDVYFDNSSCQLNNVDNVQAAIEALCQNQRNCCTLVVKPGPGWEKAFDQIREGQDAHICFQVGNYSLQNPKVVEKKGHLQLSGCGPGTRIVASTSEVALLFKKCPSVRVTALSAETGLAGRESTGARHLGGTFTFEDCPIVNLDQLRLKCAGSSRKAATCATARFTVPSTGSDVRNTVRIRNCEFTIGKEQVGILIINADRSHVEDNVLQCDSTRVRFKVADPLLLTKLRGNLIGDITELCAVAAPGGTTLARNATVSVGRFTVQFNTSNDLAGQWQVLVNASKPTRIDSSANLIVYLESLADKILERQGTLPGVDMSILKPFQSVAGRIIQQNVPAALQGIVIGGVRAGEVRVVNNTIRSVVQGIHIGVSHRETTRGTPDLAGAISVIGNNVGILLPSWATQHQHGIFVGNCNSLFVENNYLEVSRSKRDRSGVRFVEGIHVHGHVDRRVILRANHLVGFNIGIYFNPLKDFRSKEKLQWIITDNELTHSSPPGDVVKLENVDRDQIRGLQDNFQV
jgi:hypothetical protein